MHNLKGIDVDFPVGRFIAVTVGLGEQHWQLNEILFKSLANRLNKMRTKPGDHESVDGINIFDKVIEIDQPDRADAGAICSDTNLSRHVRNCYSLTPEAKIRGYKPGRFSFNVRGGRSAAERRARATGRSRSRCASCPTSTSRATCCGRRYKETLEVRFKGRSISDISRCPSRRRSTSSEDPEAPAPADTARRRARLHQARPARDDALRRRGAARDRALEAQRPGSTLHPRRADDTYHFADIEKLLDEVLQRLRDAGTRCSLIERNLDVIKRRTGSSTSGPRAGMREARSIATGTPEDVAEIEESATGRYSPRARRRARRPT